MNNSNVAVLPVVLTPSVRVMRRENQTHDRYLVNGWEVERELRPGETSLNWTPRLLPLFSFPHMPQQDIGARGSDAIPAGNAMAIVRPGYESTPLGIVTDVYRPVDHHQTVADVAETTMGKCTHEGALIDGHGYHVVHSFRLDTLSSEKVADLPLISRLTLVHDHTGTGSLRASVVCYLGKDVVIGSRNYTRRIHVGVGKQDVGVGDRSRWIGVIDAMLETASLQQASLAATLRAASTTKMTDEHAAVFEHHGVNVEREKPTKDDDGNEIPGAIVPKTALDVVIAHHKQRKGRLTWGVWSRRLEGDALAALETITGITLPKQLFKKG